MFNTTRDSVDRGYIKAKYVESIEEIGITAGFYDIKAYIPKLRK